MNFAGTIKWLNWTEQKKKKIDLLNKRKRPAGEYYFSTSIICRKRSWIIGEGIKGSQNRVRKKNMGIQSRASSSWREKVEIVQEDLTGSKKQLNRLADVKTFKFNSWGHLHVRTLLPFFFGRKVIDFLCIIAFSTGSGIKCSISTKET